MPKTIFISCGQYTAAEKELGKRISEMVRTLTDCVPFFAEEVQDLNGLDSNILSALRDCVGFITVMHPRGGIKRPGGSVLVRASVWIEQEIAIATYIQRVEKRSLPIIAFKHESVGREGIRDLLHLNPIEFTNEAEVLAELPKRLVPWKSLKPSGIELKLISKPLRQQDGHYISWFQALLVNETNNPIERYDLELRVPSGILRHWGATYPNEVPSDQPGARCFRFDQQGFGAVRPHDQRNLAGYEYCTHCAVEAKVAEGGVGGDVAYLELSAHLWTGGVEYAVSKTIQQLATER